MENNGAERQVFTAAEAATILGVHKETMRRYLRTQQIKAVKTGSSYRVSRTDLENYWKSRGGGELFEKRSKDESDQY